MTLGKTCAAWAMVLASVIGLAGCASTPQASQEHDAEAKAFKSYPNAATLYIYRSPFDRVGSDSVLYIGNRLIGSTLPGGYFRVVVWPGRYTLHGYAQDAGSLTVDVRRGTLYFIELTVAAGNSIFQVVPPDEGRKAIVAGCALLENWAPGQRPLIH